MSRITSDLFVASLVRRVFAAGDFAAVVRRGAEMAGAIYVVVRPPGGEPRLFGPAAQSLADPDGGRRFAAEEAVGEAAIEARLQRESRFDPDHWIVEIETARPEDVLDIMPAP